MLFGAKCYDIYLDRKIFDKQKLIISDFAPNGFFWGQMEDELGSNDFQDMYDVVNRICSEDETLPLADLSLKWCVAKYENEWFRAYVDDVIDDGMLRVFFVDYGTTAEVRHQDTRNIDYASVWALPPLALPMRIKGRKKFYSNS